MKKTSTIIAVSIAFLVLFFPVLLFWVFLIFSDISLNFLAPVIGLILVVLVGFITFGIANKIYYKKSIILLSVSVVLLLSSIEIENYYKHSYIPSITVDQKIDYYGSYIPFSNSKELARLDDESTLHFSKEDDLPVVDGATALIPVYCSFVEAVYPSDCKIKDFVKFSTTAGSYEGLIDGKADVVFVAQPSSEQIEFAKSSGIELNLYPIGYESFVFIVNQNNPVSNITLSQVKDIYTGKITNWKELGGKNQSIRAFQRDPNSGSQTAFVAVMGNDIELISPETHQVSEMGGLIKVVSDYQNHSNAIGYSFRYYVETMEKNINIKILTLNGVAPTVENIRNKTYPITDNFYAVTVKDRESESTRKFIQWILSAQGQELIDKVGYVSLLSHEF